MCIRDRYQRRVHGKHMKFILLFVLLIGLIKNGFALRDPSDEAQMLENSGIDMEFLYEKKWHCHRLGKYRGKYYTKEKCQEHCGVLGKCTHKKQLISLSNSCLLYTSPSPRDLSTSRMPSSA
eukprot:TRINITY_DN3523_c0_g1_i6.p2 TRINITY_DN3523_c0_g1~~TRINITY_DN3523_c0_g1_i6.p2  ORF type:complete len:122 (+),score=25.38 TRINITY_DN3523_c0_g1_i6:161-526(+)